MFALQDSSTNPPHKLWNICGQKCTDKNNTYMKPLTTKRLKNWRLLPWTTFTSTSSQISHFSMKKKKTAYFNFHDTIIFPLYGVAHFFLKTNEQTSTQGKGWCKWCGGQGLPSLPRFGAEKEYRWHKYKNHVSSFQQNSGCYQNATRRGPQPVKIVFDWLSVALET